MPRALSSLTRPKSSTLTKSNVVPARLTTTFAGLMSRWTRPFACASASERADLAQEVDDPLRRQRPELLDQRLEVEAVEQLHHVVERAVVGDAEVVELHRVRRRERGGGARLALEAAHEQLGIGPASRRAPAGG